MEDEYFRKAIENFAYDTNTTPEELLEFGIDFFDKLDRFMKMMLERYFQNNIN